MQLIKRSISVGRAGLDTYLRNGGFKAALRTCFVSRLQNSYKISQSVMHTYINRESYVIGGGSGKEDDIITAFIDFCM